jgi:hypothetical protein
MTAVKGATRVFSIRIFVVDGLPTGVRVVEKSNWIGQGLVCPRAQFAEAKSRAEFGKAGVYVLVGPSDSGQDRVYVGEGDPVKPRLEQHAGKKDFWTQAVIFTSKDEHLNKAHVQYLEARLLELARQAKRCGAIVKTCGSVCRWLACPFLCSAGRVG